MAKRTARRRSAVPLLLILLAGFLLGRASAVETPAEKSPPVSAPAAVSLPPALSTEEAESAAEEEPTETEGAETKWNLILVNSTHPLPEDFEVPTLTELRNGHAIDSRAYPSLQQMMDDARAEGLQPLICSSFRTRDKQSQLFERKVRSYLNQGFSQAEAEEQAACWVARPGTSEHQLGLAVDIVDLSYQLLDKQQESTPVQQWLMAHCAEYGFILRYPADKSELTGVEYEPWHYRYVGVEAAKAITEAGICLEEYGLPLE